MKPVLANLPIQRLRRDAKHLRRVALMPVRVREDGADVLALELLERDEGAHLQPAMQGAIRVERVGLRRTAGVVQLAWWCAHAVGQHAAA